MKRVVRGPFARLSSVWPLLLALLLALSGCTSAGDDVRGIAELPPLDRAVLVSGGAFFAPVPGADGTFTGRDENGEPIAPTAGREAIPFEGIVDVLRRARVCQHLVADDDPARRARLRRQLELREDDPVLRAFLQDARDRGFDLLLLIEELQDGPIENQGTNDRWPVTFVTWILLGVGALIPDRTFESRATLRVSLRELQTGRVVYEMLQFPGPVELSLTERSDWFGLALSIIVPPFWVDDDRDEVAESVRRTAQRRLLLSLARDLKGDVLRRRIDERGAATIELLAGPSGPQVLIRTRESLGAVRVRGPAFDGREADGDDLCARLMASREIRDGVFHYEAALPEGLGDARFQVRVATLRGGIASATFTARSAR